MGGDGKAAIDAARKLDASMPVEVVAQFAIMQPVKAAPYTTHAQFSDPDTILKLAAPPREPRARRDDVPLRARRRVRAQGRRRVGARRDRGTRAHRARHGLEAVRRVERAREGDRPDRAARRDRPARRGGGRPGRRRARVRGGGLRRGLARLHGAAVLVLPGAPVARGDQAAAGQAGRGGEDLPRVAGARAQQRLGARGARGDLPTQGQRHRRTGDAAGVRERVVRQVPRDRRSTCCDDRALSARGRVRVSWS